MFLEHRPLTLPCLRTRLSVYSFHAQKSGVRFLHGPSNLPLPPAILSLAPEHEKEARVWLTSFRTAATVPKSLVELSFSRSSGPGGQVEYQSHHEQAKLWG